MKEQLVQVIDKKDLQVLILTDGYNIHHLSGYRGHTGMLVAFQGEQYILTDSRYTEQVELEAPEFTCVDIGREGYSKTIAAMVQKAFAKEGRSTLRIGFENKEISYMQYQAFVDTFAKELTGMQVEFVPLEDAVNVYREVKTEDEIAKLARAEQIGDEAFTEIVKFIHENWKDGLNPLSEVIIPNAMMEAMLFGRRVEDHVQFERLGYFVVDKDTTTLGRMVYNRSCSLRSLSVCSKHILF